ncbi:hypothetical protein FRC12_017583 [Ceratobasidium sp. 428]|nr:hypothetical protein FRC12_017583 [Ceratobasidium sp. 428]
MPARYTLHRGARKALGVATDLPRQNTPQSPKCIYLFMMSVASLDIERVMYDLYGQNLRLLRGDEKYQLRRTTMLNCMPLIVSTLQLIAVSTVPLASIIIYLTSAWFFVYFMEAARQMCLQRANANPNSDLVMVCIFLQVNIRLADPSV